MACRSPCSAMLHRETLNVAKLLAMTLADFDIADLYKPFLHSGIPSRSLAPDDGNTLPRSFGISYTYTIRYVRCLLYTK